MDKRVLILNEEGVIQDRPKPISPKKKVFDEKFLQKLIFNEPELLADENLDSDYSKLIPLSREVAVSSGSIDVVYLTPEGRICIVETKLWRNPEAHRTVIAQIIDYAKALATMSFDEFCQVVTREKSSIAVSSFFKKLRLKHRDFDENELQSRIQESLTNGRFLLLVVGDKIFPEVVLLKEAIASAPNLEFNIALAELRFYRLEKNPNHLLVIPKIVGKTVEHVRAVVKIRYEEKKPAVEVTAFESSQPSKTGKTNKREFASSMPEDFSDIFLPVYEDWRKKGYFISWGTIGFTIRHNLRGKMKTLIEIYPTYMSVFTDKWCKKKNLPKEICKAFQNSVRNIPVLDRIIGENRVYINYKDISIDEYSKILSETDKTLEKIITLYQETTIRTENREHKKSITQ